MQCSQAPSPFLCVEWLCTQFQLTGIISLGDGKDLIVVISVFMAATKSEEKMRTAQNTVEHDELDPARTHQFSQSTVKEIIFQGSQ